MKRSWEIWEPSRSVEVCWGRVYYYSWRAC